MKILILIAPVKSHSTQNIMRAGEKKAYRDSK